jgi:hypothetical protein
MIKSAFMIALSLSTSAIASPQPASAENAGAGHATRVAFLENIWGGEHHGERHGHHSRHWDEDDDHDDGGRHHGRKGAENRPADPNAANTPTPDNGVFTGKTRPKVEVQ